MPPLARLRAGHEDCDDLDVLRHDTALKMFCEKSPEADVGLARQPPLSRLENAVGWRVLARMGLRMIDTFCDSFARPPPQIVLDIDDTTDLVHGGQQLSLFNTPGGGYCFQPILIFEAATEKPVAAFGRGRRAGAVPCPPAHSLKPAPDRHHRARRCPLRHARGHGCCGRYGLPLHLRPFGQ